MSDKLRLPAEETYASELKALRSGDNAPKPEGWAMSPQAVVTYLMGGKAADGTEISPKYVGQRRLIETAVATLATDRALLLLGVPRYREVLGVRASGRRRFRRFHHGHPVHRRHRRKPGPLLLELRTASRKGGPAGRRLSLLPSSERWKKAKPAGLRN